MAFDLIRSYTVKKLYFLGDYKMKNYIKITNIRLVISCALFFLGSVNQAKSVLIKSEINNEKQSIDVYFTEQVLCYSEVEKVCGKNFDLEEEFDHDDIYRQVTYKKLTEIIKDSIGYRNTNTSNIVFNFYNIANKKHLDLLCDYMFNFNNILGDIYDERSVRIKNLEVKYYYFDDITSPYQIYHGRTGWTQGTDKPKKKFEEYIQQFKELKIKITNIRQEMFEEKIDTQRQFLDNNYPKANIFKGEDN